MSIYALFKCSPLVYTISMNKLRKEITKDKIIAYSILIGLGLVVATNGGNILLFVLNCSRYLVYGVGIFFISFLPYSIYLDGKSQEGLTLAQRVGGTRRMRMYVYGKSGSKFHS